MVASLFVDSLRFIPDNSALLLHKTAGLVVLAFTALGIAMLIALPVGLWLGHRHRGLSFALGTSSIARAIPSIALIGIFIVWFGVGFWNNAVVLVILAIPPILANSYVAVAGVDRDVVEAARGMGLTERQILAQVELPLGLPLILTGIRIAAVFVISTATLAGIAGLPGTLGDIIVNQAAYGRAGVLAAAFCVAGVALLTAFLLGLVQRAATRRMAPRA